MKEIVLKVTNSQYDSQCKTKEDLDYTKYRLKKFLLYDYNFNEHIDNTIESIRDAADLISTEHSAFEELIGLVSKLDNIRNNIHQF